MAYLLSRGWCSTIEIFNCTAAEVPYLGNFSWFECWKLLWSNVVKNSSTHSHTPLSPFPAIVFDDMQYTCCLTLSRFQ